MKRNYSLKVVIFFLLLLCNIKNSTSQTVGDITFVGFNTVGGDDDFSILILTDLPVGTILYFSDSELDGLGGLVSSEGVLKWNTGSTIIRAGTVINFNDVSNDANRRVTVGSVTEPDLGFNLTDKDGIFIYKGTDENSPTTFIAGIQIGNLSEETGDLANSGLQTGTSHIIIDNSASPDGGFYNGSRSNKNSYPEYLTEIGKKTNWSTTTKDGEAFTQPFSQEAFTTSITTWTGTNNSQWNLAENWSQGIPKYSSLVTIPNVGFPPEISNGTTGWVGNLIIESEKTLTINSLNSLTVSGDLTIDGNLVLNNGASLIIRGRSKGNFAYNINVNDTNWHLVSSPVVGEQYDDIWNGTNLINISGTGNNAGIGTYINTTDIDGDWLYFQKGSASQAFEGGQGYSLLRTQAGKYNFFGVFPEEDVIRSINQGFENKNKWNLVGNPFPSYIKVSELLMANAANLTDTHQMVYVWDGKNYIALTGADYIHPGQGFFVNAENSIINNFVIQENLQSHQTGITFYKKPNDPTIKLIVTDGTQDISTEINYLADKTAGLDPGFDVGTFSENTKAFSIYSHLVSNNKGVSFMRQAVPQEYENIIIPIGINAIEGKELTFKIESSNLPGVKVFLEDAYTNHFIRLDEVANLYRVKLAEMLKGTGRFYLHTSKNALNLNDAAILKKINIYTFGNSSLRIVGMSQGRINCKVFSILGKQLLSVSFQSTGAKEIYLPKLATGIYIVQLRTEKGILNKKIVLK